MVRGGNVLFGAFLAFATIGILARIAGGVSKTDPHLGNIIGFSGFGIALVIFIWACLTKRELL